MPASDETALVGVLLPRPEAAAAIVACWEAGEAVLPLDPAAPPADQERTLAGLRPTHLLTRDGRRPYPGGAPVAAAVAAVVTTSGTTGERKGVELTRAGLVASGRAVAGALGAGAPGSSNCGWLCCLPLHHVAGLAVLGRAWATGAGPVTVHPGFDPASVAGAARRGGFVSLVPTMLRRLLDARAPLAAFRGILLGGGPVDPALRAEAEAAGAKVHATYGMTETWGGVVHDGFPLAGVELRLTGSGEILLRAPTVMAGYRLDPGATAAALDGADWFHTGDIGRLEPDTGRLRFADRLGDMINSGGVKVSPTAVERALLTHPGVADVAVAGRPDAQWGERVVAFVVPAEAARPPGLDDLRAHVGATLPAAHAPRQTVVVESIPRTAGGKTLRRLLPPAE